MQLYSLVFAIVLIAALVTLTINLKRLFSYLKVAQPEDRSSNPGLRIKNMLKIAIAQSKILRDKVAGPVHAAIFWGFIILLFSASEAVLQGFFPHFSWNILGPVYTVITFSTDIFCSAIIISIIIALYRRFVAKVPRLQGDKHEKIDAVIVLGAIFIIVTSLLLQNSAATVIRDEEWAFRPIASLIGSGFYYSTAINIYNTCWWLHIVTILAFANYLPFSKHFHVYTSVPNTYFASLTFPNKLAKINFEQEGLEKFGVVDIEDFSWRTMFDSYTCTHCGRCTAACPANSTGKVLDPRNVIVQVRSRTIDYAPLLVKKKQAEVGDVQFTEAEQAIVDKKFIGEYENIEALWQCTTCGACMKECPVTIEHVPPIINMRRSLVMMESNFPSELQGMFSNLENNATPWAFSPSERADWAEGTGVKIAAEHPDFDILFWVGCIGSFDDRAKKISVAFSKLMHQADVNFAILGSEEMCNGDPGRRAGHEYLADMLIKQNIETLNRYNVKKIVTICPHCFNTFKNEYPEFGASYEVIHHTEFLKQLIDNGKLKLIENGTNPLNFTYHDSCYLGRYNNIYEAPRNIIESIPGAKLSEVSRSGDKGFCCGAGGARMFMEETEGKRVNIERTEELLATGAETIALNCPFCMTMITDGVKDKDKMDDVKVKDIAEILLEHIELTNVD